MRRLVALVGLWPSTALADAVEGPPTDCPPGAIGVPWAVVALVVGTRRARRR